MAFPPLRQSWHTQHADAPMITLSDTLHQRVFLTRKAWMGVYTGISDSETPTGYLGSSLASVAWGAGGTGDQFTWTFGNDFSATVGDGNQLVFMFQTESGEQSSQLNIPNNTIAIQRLGNSESYTDNGAGIWHGNGPDGFQEFRVPVLTLEITAVPEPSTALLGGLGLLALLRRRR